MPLRLFLDANVLYSALLRDLVLRLAVERVCQVHWSAEVQHEWKRHLVDDAGYAEAVIARTQARMDAAFPQARVTGYEGLIPELSLPDPADCHVLAAAVQARVSVLVTFNLKDFPPEVLAGHGLLPLHPDVLLPRLWAESPDGFRQALQRLMGALKAPPMGLEDIAAALANLQMPRTALLLRDEIRF